MDLNVLTVDLNTQGSCVSRRCWFNGLFWSKSDRLLSNFALSRFIFLTILRCPSLFTRQTNERSYQSDVVANGPITAL